MKKIIPILIFFLAFGTCLKVKKGEKKFKKALLSLVLGSNSPILISSIVPKVGSPPQKISIKSFEGTKVTIRGSGFTAATKVTFENVKAKITKQTSKLLIVTVPKGAKTGKLRVFNGASCSRQDELSATSSCKATKFYIDCYSTLKGLYGGEINVKLNQYQTINYDIPATKAFRSALIKSNEVTDNKKINYRINISCSTYSSVRMHNPSCEPNNSDNKLKHEFNISTSYTPQYYISAGRGTCNISIL